MGLLWGQESFLQVEYLKPIDVPQKLNYNNLIKFSENIRSDSIKFVRDRDYQIDYLEGRIFFNSENILSQPQVKIEYKVIPKAFLEDIFLYRLMQKGDSTYVVQKNVTPSIFPDSNKLLINGSKTFSISFSDQKDFDINQSLYLKLSGEIASNLYIESQLSDSNSPISIEGGSQELSSLDKVFISLYNDNFDLSFGDLDLEISNTSYINYLAQFEGLKLGLYQGQSEIIKANSSERNQFRGALAVSQGKNASYRFSGVEGKQGPYYIYIADSNQNIQLIANSEKLYIDGTLAIRGVDYYIDYSEGSITFEKLVTSETEFYITFEYSDEKYRNNLYITSTNYRLTDYLDFSFNAIHRADDKDNPLEDIHTESDLDAFALAGDSLIYANGIYEVDEGDGNYISDVTSTGEVIYTYVGYGEDGNYNVYFSYVGSGEGSYREFSPNKYEYVGLGNGDYEPLRKLSPPQKLTNYDFKLVMGNESIYLDLEALVSDYDQNTLSSKQDSDNQGIISQASLHLNHQEDNWSTENLINYEYKSKNLQSFADLEDPLELSYGGGITSYDSLKSETIKTSSKVKVKDLFRVAFLYKRQNIPSLMTNNVFTTSVSNQEKRFIPSLSYDYSSKNLDYHDDNQDKYNYHNHLLTVVKRIYHFKNSLELLREQSEDKLTGEYKLGFRYKKFSYTASSLDYKHLTFSTSYWLDERDKYFEQAWEKSSNSQTLTNSLLFSFKNHTSNIDHTIRKVTNNSENETDNLYNMIRVNSTHSMFDNGWDLNYNYRVNNLEFYPKIRELEYVGDGLGDYDSLGVYQDEGDYEWLYVNAGDAELSTELNFNFGSYLRLSRFTEAFILRNLNAEIRGLITEDSKTSDRMKLYLLNPQILMNDQTTLYGRNNFVTSLIFNSDNRKLNQRISWEWDSVMDNRYQEANRTKMTLVDYEIIVRKLMFGNIGSQFIYREEDNSRYNSLINDYTSILKYQTINSGTMRYNANLKYKYEKGKTSGLTDDYQLQIGSLANTITANLVSNYLLQFSNELIYTLRDGSDYLTFLPEKRAGFSTKWTISTKYNYNQYVTFNLSYQGNKYPQAKMENNLNIEVKAEF